MVQVMISLVSLADTELASNVIDRWMQYGALGIIAFLLVFGAFRGIPFIFGHFSNALEKQAHAYSIAQTAQSEVHREIVNRLMILFESERKQCAEERANANKRYDEYQEKERAVRHDDRNKIMSAHAELANGMRDTMDKSISRLEAVVIRLIDEVTVLIRNRECDE